MDMSSLGRRLVRLGEKLGANEVEVYIEEAVLRNITLAKEIESFGSTYSSGLGVRVAAGKRIGLSSTTSLDLNGTEQAVRRAYSIAKTSKPIEDWVSFAIHTGMANVKGVFDPEICTLSPETMAGAAREMLSTVHHQNAALFVTRGGVLTEVRTTTIVNSHNHALVRSESSASASISISAREGNLKSVASESDVTHLWRSLDVAGTSRKASERAVREAKARPIPSGSIPVIWKGKLFANLLSAMFTGTLSAESVQNKRSPWIGKIGLRIASDQLTLTDKGSMENGIGTREFDDEGIPQKCVPLIEKGVLTGYLYDTFSANRDHVESTGNASRSYDSPPHPSPNNMTLASGSFRPDELVKETRRGLYLEELIGLWLSSPISGYVSAAVANGMLVEKGELTQPVKGVLVSGNFFDILEKRIDAIDGEKDHSVNVYSPTVRVSSMSITPQ